MFTSQQIADTYDQIGLNFSATRGKLSSEVISLLPKLEKNATVLDLGCGNGVLLSGLPKDINYTGIDISSSLVNIAKKLYPDNNFVLADLLDQSIWNKLDQYDFIVALAVFHHLPSSEDHTKLLQNIKQHLKPGGIILISTWRLNQPKFNKYRVDAKLFSLPFHSGPKRDFYAFSDNELHELVRDASFNQTKSFTAKDNLYLTATT